MARCAYTVLLNVKVEGSWYSVSPWIGRSLVRLNSRTLTRSSHGNLSQSRAKVISSGAVGETQVRCETVKLAAILASRVKCWSGGSRTLIGDVQITLIFVCAGKTIGLRRLIVTVVGGTVELVEEWLAGRTVALLLPSPGRVGCMFAEPADWESCNLKAGVQVVQETVGRAINVLFCSRDLTLR
jgi:hypothetical protein